MATSSGRPHELFDVGIEQLAIADDLELDPVGVERLARQLGGEHGVLGRLAARGVGQEVHLAAEEIDQALVVAGEADAADRGGDHLRAARGDRVEHHLTVGIAGRAEEQPRGEAAAGNDEGLRHRSLQIPSISSAKSPTLPGAHDFDAVARPQRRRRPRRPAARPHR